MENGTNILFLLYTHIEYLGKDIPYKLRSAYDHNISLQCMSKSYTVNLESIAVHTDPKYFDLSDLKVMGRNRVLTGNFTIFEDLDEHFTTKMEFYSDSAGIGNFKRVPVEMEELSPCDSLARYGSYIEKTLQPVINTNLPVKGDVCPVLAGNYYFKDVVFNVDDWPSQVPRGLMKIIYIVLKDGKSVSECELMLRVENKLIYS